MRPKELALLVFLGAIWGLSYVFIRVAAPALGPAVLMGVRFALGGTTLLGIALARGTGRQALRDLRTHWRELTIIGVFIGAMPTTLIGLAELRITASLATVLNASVPFFAALGSTIWLGESLPKRRIGGLLLGFLGVALAAGGPSILAGGSDGLFIGASILAAASYGLSAVYIRRKALPITGVSSSIGSQITAGVVLAPIAAATYRPTALTGPVLVSALGLALLSTALAYLIYFYLIETAGPTQTSTVTFVSPAFGIAGGAFLLHEAIGPGLLAGLGLIVIGVLMSSDSWSIFRPGGSPVVPVLPPPLDPAGQEAQANLGSFVPVRPTGPDPGGNGNGGGRRRRD